MVISFQTTPCSNKYMIVYSNFPHKASKFRTGPATGPAKPKDMRSFAIAKFTISSSWAIGCSVSTSVSSYWKHYFLSGDSKPVPLDAHAPSNLSAITKFYIYMPRTRIARAKSRLRASQATSPGSFGTSPQACRKARPFCLTAASTMSLSFLSS